MCGIAGYFTTAAASRPFSADPVAAMTDTLVHRGPDDDGTWVDEEAGVALGNRRLAIIDLSEAGRQPMQSSCGSFVIAYNGEIYNAADLRTELEQAGRTFRGYSDTEVIVEGCATWGVEQTAKRIIGMFAFALWDKRARRLFLVRDRLGIKPLYWTVTNGVLIFGSELKALKAHPLFEGAVDRDAVASYLRHTFIPAPYTIYQGVQKLEPGKLLTLDADSETKIRPYWSLEEVVREGQEEPFGGAEEDAVDALDGLLRDAVSRRMVSDVPLGAFLSGGIDSSTVVALMQTQSNRPVRTFTIGYEREGFNEAHDAAAVAAHLGTEHTKLYATSEQARDVIPSLAHYYDEPFADSSQIPTFLVSRLTKQHVTVALSGDGGDELFGGYTRYFTADKFRWPLFESPRFLRHTAGHALGSLSPGTWDRIAALIPSGRRPAHFGEQIHKLARALNGTPNSFYKGLVSHWSAPETLIAGAQEYKTVAWDETLGTRIPDLIDRMQYLDTATYLHDDILTKVDRASMAVSLEVRVPIIDHRVVEFAWTLPRNMKVRNGEGKWILRQLLQRYVPNNLVKKRKMGFAVPIAEWLRGPLREWAEDLISPQALNKYGLLDPEPVQRVWQENLKGDSTRPLKLWSVLMLQAWCNEHLG